MLKILINMVSFNGTRTQGTSKNLTRIVYSTQTHTKLEYMNQFPHHLFLGDTCGPPINAAANPIPPSSLSGLAAGKASRRRAAQQRGNLGHLFIATPPL